MCANATYTASSSPTGSTSRSLFSRLTSPLKARTRNLTDFHIKPLEPHRQYSPGDLVKGAVVLEVVKPIRITHLTVCLHGFVHVYKHANGANEPLPDTGQIASANPMKSQYFGNGYCSLFQDEQTLCGEGRLDPGIYQFNFELEFPSKDIPTSIDFERGTISYQISATVTRPTSIAATSTCDKKVHLVERVDIGPMAPPRPRTISLEPISKRAKKKRPVKPKDTPASASLDNAESGSVDDGTTTIGSPGLDESVSQVETLDNQIQPQSPAQSDVQSNFSADSTVSSSTGMSFRLGPVPPSARSARDSQGNSSNSMEDKTITATIELLKSGCLPGDYLPLKINIQHTKAIKSMHGIIITLYRQGRIDSAPPLSLFKDIKGKDAERLKHEEYYPKSKTGLGGLSLSSAGSTSVFRKDLSQTFAPLIVDPTTLSAYVTASVRVPEDCFPTISGVPGQMITFKYQVEVVVDLGGKLAGQKSHLPRVGTVTLPTSYGMTGNRTEGNANMLAALGGSIVETDHIRREKSVVACVFEVIVGTMDSARDKARRAGKPSSSRPVTPNPAHDSKNEEAFDHEYIHEHNNYPNHPYSHYNSDYEHQYSHYPNDYEYNHNYEQYENQYADPPPFHTQVQIPPPEIEAEEGLSEKERVMRAEQRLLPSQPPDFASSSAAGNVAPSAPHDLSDDLYTADDVAPASFRPLAFYPTHQADVQSNHSYHPPSSIDDEDATAPSAPSFSDLTPHATNNHTDDKQELERQRLLAEASAPSDFPDGEDEGESSRQGAIHEPSAPVLNEDHEYGGPYTRRDVAGSSHDYESSPPRYER